VRGWHILKHEKNDQTIENDVIFDPVGRWASSPLNTLSCVVSKPVTRPGRILIKDETLRSGANTPGVKATIEKKLQIAEALEAMGVREVEAGYPGIAEHCQFMRALKEMGSKLRLGAHTRIWVSNFKEEIDRAIDSGADVINFVGGADPLQGQALHPEILGDPFLDHARKAISYAKSKGVLVAFGSADPGPLRCFHNWLLAASEAGAERLYIYDGRGWFLPETIEFLVRYARDLLGERKEIAVHCHDDFGLATANSLAAIRAGADLVDVTVLSTGHRCGNAAFEQVVPALEALYGISTGIDLQKITALCSVVAEAYEIQVPPNAPVAGENMYKYGGLHIRALLEGSWYLWESLRAETVGKKRILFFGPTALQRGSTGPVGLKMVKMGIEPDESLIDRVIGRLEKKMKKVKEMSEADVEDVIVKEAKIGKGRK
jgi:isopropylmalate/homocitrate/citramalate synthase